MRAPRAVQIAYEDFIKYQGGKGAKDAGTLRLEGKEYVVQEGDVLLFRCAGRRLSLRSPVRSIERASEAPDACPSRADARVHTHTPRARVFRFNV